MFDKLWLSRDELMQYLDIPNETALRRILKNESFPKPSEKLGRYKPRWKRLDIDAFMEAPDNNDVVENDPRTSGTHTNVNVPSIAEYRRRIQNSR